MILQDRRPASVFVLAVVAIGAVTAIGSSSAAGLRDGEPSRQPGAGDPREALPPGPFEKVGEIPGGVPRKWSPAFDPAGDTFFTMTDKGATVWDARTIKPLTPLLPHEHVRYARFVAGGKTLFTAGAGGEVRFWDVATAGLLSATVVERKLYFADASADGTRFTVIGRQDVHLASVWRTGEARPALLLRHTHHVNAAIFDPAGSRIVTYGRGSPTHVWSAETGRELYAPIESGTNYFTADRARFDPAGTRLLVDRDRGFAVVDATTGRTLVGVELEGYELRTGGHLRFSGDGRKVAVAMTKSLEFHTARVYDAATGRLEREFGADMYDCQIGPGGRWAWCNTVGREPANVQEVWDLATGARVQTVELTGQAPAMSPDGSTVLVGTHWETLPRTTAVWRLRPGEPAKRP